MPTLVYAIHKKSGILDANAGSVGLRDQELVAWKRARKDSQRTHPRKHTGVLLEEVLKRALIWI